ncbi:MAG TPA: sigma-70 family RNA polymerase sigma factor, partial [Planctomycetota bacterium]|nr:sigma-70 family RNA polymerase sigma factor [Planctomycetota bacterium]
MADITQILQDVQAGRTGAPDELAAALYEELRAVARRDLAGERVGHTLQPTALVNEAWLRLFNGQEHGFQSRAHFFAAAATAIRRVLADHARRRQAEKRGGGAGRVPLEAVDEGGPVRSEDVLALDEALERLAAFAPEQARIVELRFFAGMTTEELALALGISVSTAERHWRLARAWLRCELG